MPRLTEKELLEHIKGYHDQMIEITEKTALQVQTLSRAVDALDKQKLSKWNKYKSVAVPAILLVLIFLFLLGLRKLDYCKINVESFSKGGVERCEQETIQETN